jgi:ketosteroid isomerase-like protein
MVRLIALFLMTAAAFGENAASEETQIWNVEKAYWDFVKANDLEKYRAFWHEDFVGWPLFSLAPVRKDHITDWIADNTSKGVKLQSYSIEQLAIHVTGDIAVNIIESKWTGPTAKGTKQRRRDCESRIPGSARSAHGKSSVGWLRP